MFQVTIRVKAH